MKVNACPDRIITVQDKEYLYFGGTAYLGLPKNKMFQKLVAKNILKWGTTYGSSRNANISLSAYEDGERFLANFINAEAVLTVSSGMLAGKLIIETLKPTTSCFFHFPDTHTALKVDESFPIWIDGEIHPRLLDNVSENITILADAVPSSQIQAQDLSVTALFSKTKKITLVLDESHSIGILGQNGCGIYASTQIPVVERKIMLSSLGKALGLTGGMIGADLEFITLLRTNPSFVSSAGMNPAFAQSLADAGPIFKKQHKKLLKKCQYIQRKLKSSPDFPFNPNYPVIYPTIKNSSAIFEKENIIITHFPYPNLVGELNRIVITANHKKNDLDKIIGILNQY
ncbi:aminotransferase class I/II [Flavobacterium faecale]|uniref:Aminotransferase class I/II n=1 Tax=Flavobacterium faecale TaxID=1355330 RepID=A0A2S1LD62_9FLAO|nr:aminotransferase class I/II-fold pyridoxal phosphate-dependent enzyme [Flavobacterium faecale]AWG21702.1 aminotransferase class I/II [Flavobacterium faecale]